jgi:hypothetical protein
MKALKPDLSIHRLVTQMIHHLAKSLGSRWRQPRSRIARRRVKKNTIAETKYNGPV